MDAAYVSGRLFDVLGVTAIHGRLITPADDGGGGADGRGAVISHCLWRQRFAGANDVVGRTITVQRVPFTIIGVMPPGFVGPDVGRMTDVMLPFASEPLIQVQESRLTATGSAWVQIMVRLKPGQSLDQANAALRVVQSQIVESSTVSRQREAAVGLYGVVAHGVRARQAEIGLRMSLGAAPSRIVRLVFQRVGVLIAAGLGFGLAGSLWAAGFVEALLFRVEGRDPGTFAGAAAVLVAVGALVVWMPARRAARLDPATVLRES